LVTFAHEQSWSISLPSPRQVRQWAQGTGQRAKTAPRGPPQDALVLARFGAAQQPATHRPLAIEVSELDSLLQRRQDLEQMIQQEKNRLGPLAPEMMFLILNLIRLITKRGCPWARFFHRPLPAVG
jgi:hypothetical protein